MTVAELIAVLRTLPQHLTVITDCPMGSHGFQLLHAGIGVVVTDDLVDDSDDPMPEGEYVAFSRGFEVGP